jgi:3'(2'), 5'-bisphosphate nucleotidase
MFDQYESELNFAIEAVKTAAELCRRIQVEMVLPAVTKSDRSPVTVADFASQAVVARAHREAFPDVPLVAEEDSGVLRDIDGEGTLKSVHEYVLSIHPDATPGLVCDWIDFGAGEPGDRFWTLDPIDGTKGFLRGDQYVVALGLIEKGEVVLGAMGCPNLNQDMLPDHGGGGSIAYAVRGQGAWTMSLEGGEPRKLQVSQTIDPIEARMLRSFESSHTDPEKIDELVGIMGISADPVLMDSQAKYGLLAAGHGEFIFRLLSPMQPGYQEKIWDQAAGSILVEEAGGRVTDLKGSGLDFSQGRTLNDNIGVLASNGWLHDQALRALYQAGVDRRPESE